MKSIHELLNNSAKSFPDKPAVIFENKRYSYGELFNKSQSLSNFIQEKTTPGDVVSILYENSPFFIISYFSILKSGCIAHIIPPAISDFNLKEQIKESNPQIILTNPNFEQKLKRTGLIEKVFFVENNSDIFTLNHNTLFP